MDFVGMMRRAAGGPSEPGPSAVDQSKPSIRKALQNRGGVMRRQENPASNAGGYPLPQVGKHSNVIAKQEAEGEKDSESMAERFKVVTQLSSHLHSHIDNAKQRIFPFPLFSKPLDSIDEGPVSEAHLLVSNNATSTPATSVHTPAPPVQPVSDTAASTPATSVQTPAPPVQPMSDTAASTPATSVQTPAPVQPVSVTFLPCAWRSSSSASEPEQEDEHEVDCDCDAGSERHDNSASVVARFKAVAQLSTIHNHAEVAKQQIFAAVSQVSNHKSSREEMQKQEEDPETDAHLPGGVGTMPVASVHTPTTAIMEPVSVTSVPCAWRGSSSSSDSESENDHEHEHVDDLDRDSDCDADSETEDKPESKMDRLKAVTKETAAAAAQGFGRLSELLTDKGKIPSKGLERLSELLAVQSSVILTRGEKLVVEKVQDPSAKPDSAMLSAIRNRGGIMPTHDGFEAFYGIENPDTEPNMISASGKDCIGTRKDSLDSPRDAFESFYGYDDADDHTPPKKAAPPRLRLGSLEGLKDSLHDDSLSPEPEVPNFSLDTFRRVY